MLAKPKAASTCCGFARTEGTCFKELALADPETRLRHQSRGAVGEGIEHRWGAPAFSRNIIAVNRRPRQ